MDLVYIIMNLFFFGGWNLFACCFLDGYQSTEIIVRWDVFSNVTLPEPSSDFTLTELRLLSVVPQSLIRNLSTGKSRDLVITYNNYPPPSRQTDQLSCA